MRYYRLFVAVASCFLVTLLTISEPTARAQGVVPRWEALISEINAKKPCGNCEASVPVSFQLDQGLAAVAWKAVEEDRRKQGKVEPTIICGRVDSEDEFKACVAIYPVEPNGTLGKLIGSGVLAQNSTSILTAKHVALKVQERSCVAIFAVRPREAEWDRRVRILPNPSCHPTLDLAVLRLEGRAPVDVQPLMIGAASKVSKGERIRLVGYGLEQAEGNANTRRTVTVHVEDAPCSQVGSQLYGCKEKVEFVATEPLAGCDSCDYDSGGPGLTKVHGVWQVTGVIKDGVKKNARGENCARLRGNCGCGTICTYANEGLNLFR